jgi:predicted dehydrogenase
VKFSNGPYPAIWGIRENSKAFLIGQVIHIFNLIRFFGGEVGEVYAKLNQVTDAKFGYAITVGFENGAVGVMNLNALELPEWCANERLVVTGFDSWLEVDDMVHLRYYPRTAPIAGFTVGGRRQAIEWSPDWTEILATKAEGAFGYRGELEAFARSCIGEERPKSNLWDGAKDLLVSESVWESASTGRIVKVSGRA